MLSQPFLKVVSSSSIRSKSNNNNNRSSSSFLSACCCFDDRRYYVRGGGLSKGVVLMRREKRRRRRSATKVALSNEPKNDAKLGVAASTTNCDLVQDTHVQRGVGVFRQHPLGSLWRAILFQWLGWLLSPPSCRFTVCPCWFLASGLPVAVL